MAREHPTAIEKLNVEHPGLKLDVDLLLDNHSKLSEICASLKEKYGVTVPESTLSYYQHKRWWPTVLRIRNMKENVLAIRKALEEGNSEELGDAIIMEKLALSTLEDVSPTTLLREERERRKLKIEEGRLQVAIQQMEVENGKLKLAIAQFEQERDRERKAFEEATNEAIGKIRNGSSVTADDIGRIRERVYGIGPEAAASHPA